MALSSIQKQAEQAMLASKQHFFMAFALAPASGFLPCFIQFLPSLFLMINIEEQMKETLSSRQVAFGHGVSSEKNGTLKP